MTRLPCLPLLGFVALLVPAQAFAEDPPAAGTTAPAPLHLVIVGDSTVCDYPEAHANRGWGQFVREYFRNGRVMVTNLAVSGASTKSFLRGGRWQKALAEKPDFVLIQFGHNDSHPPDKPESTDPAGDYKDNLRRFVDEARAAGATPVLVTPVVRRTFDAAGRLVEVPPPPGRKLSAYAAAMKEVAAEKQAPVIDLHESSRAWIERLGPQAGAGMAGKKGDETHFNEQGARAVAALVMKELPAAVPQLKESLAAPRAPAPAKPAVAVKATGAAGDGKTLDTAAIQQAIDSCAAGGGGTVTFPPGRYLTGTIQIKSHVTLRLEAGATLLGSTDPAAYRNLDPFTDGSGNPLGHALVVAVDAEDVGIEGAGTIDGQSPQLMARQKPYTLRPFLLRWVRCTNIAVRDVRLTNPGAWTLNFFQSRNAVVEGVTIRCRDLKMHNNDGINIDSCENVRVRNCDVASGDDALVIKSTSRALPSRDIQATHCRLSTRTNAIKLGTESIGGFEHISITDCRITNTRMAGIALYAVDGGDLRDVTVSDITMDGVAVPVSIRLGARLKTFRAGDQPRTAPGQLRDVTLRNVTATNIGMVGMLVNGVPGHPVEALTLENIRMDLPGGGTANDAKVRLREREDAYPEHNMFGKTLPAHAIYARHVRGVKFHNVTTGLAQPDARPATVFIDVEGVTPANFAAGFSKPK